MNRFLGALLQPGVLLYALALLALLNLWRKRRETRGRLLLLTVPFVVLLLCSVPAVSYLAMGTLEWPYPPLEERPGDIDAIVVLSGYIEVDGGGNRVELGEDTLYRCLCGLQMYRQGKPCPILVSGGKVDPAAPGPTLAEAMRDFLLSQGVASTDLIVESQARTTYENAVHSAPLLRERGLNRILLVTDARHLFRAEGCFRKQGLEVVPCGCRYRAMQMDGTVWNFVPNPTGMRGLHSATHEWLGTAWYWLGGKL